MKIIWIDFLCYESALQVLKLSKLYPIERVYFINVSQSFVPFIKLLENFLHKPVTQITDIVESSENLNGISVFESIYRKIEDVQNGWLKRPAVKERNLRFTRLHCLNPSKYDVHLQEMSYTYLFRPVEIGVLAAHNKSADNALYLIRKGPFQEIIKEHLGINQTFFYSTVVSHYLFIQNRPNYIRDLQLNEKYFKPHLFFILKQFAYWMAAFAVGVLSFFRRNGDRIQKVNIGVELIQSRIRLNEINDLFWIQHSGIDPQTVYGLEFEDYDEESISLLEKLGIKRCRVEQNPLRYLIRLFLFGRNQQTQPFYVPLRYAFRTFSWISKLWYPLIFWNEGGWLSLQETTYLCRKEYWKSIYQRLGIQILWSMHDLDEDKAAKAQALEELNGFYVGSHWSNFVIFRTDGQKCYDVLFTWGKHFIDLMFNRYPFLKIFITGYPSDHYFIGYKKSAQELRNRNPKKFILSYHDSNMANDMANSQETQIQIHEMLIDLLEENKNLIVFLKPKREVVFKQIIKDVKGLSQLLEDGRICVFLGKSLRTKVTPAEIGMASDLAFGLGISTAATECFFAGTIAFHADFTGFNSNSFVAKGLNTIVFNNVIDLQRAIQESIDGVNQRSYQDYKEYYEALDPFQDGKSYLRTGFIMNRLQHAFKKGLDRKETLTIVNEQYNQFLAESHKEREYDAFK